MTAATVLIAVAVFLWMAAITTLAVVVVAGLVAERFNCRANRRQNKQLADFDEAHPQFNEDHPGWNRQ